jgi:hypothetical protein
MPAKKKTIAELRQWMHKQLFEQIPFNVAIIDKDYNVVEANNNIKEYFGDWKKQKCYKVYQKFNSPCKDCESQAVFEDYIVVDGLGYLLQADLRGIVYNNFTSWPTGFTPPPSTAREDFQP